MPIPATNPVTVAPVPEKVYDAQHILDLNVRSHKTGEGQIHISTAPLHSESGEILKQQQTAIREDLWEIAANVPEAAAAIQAVYAAVPAIQAYIESRDAENPEE